MNDIIMRHPPIYAESTEVPTGDINRDALRLIVMCRVWDKELRAAIWFIDEGVRIKEIIANLRSEQQNKHG